MHAIEGHLDGSNNKTIDHFISQFIWLAQANSPYSSLVTRIGKRR